MYCGPAQPDGGSVRLNKLKERKKKKIVSRNRNEVDVDFV